MRQVPSDAGVLLRGLTYGETLRRLTVDSVASALFSGDDHSDHRVPFGFPLSGWWEADRVGTARWQKWQKICPPKRSD